MINNIVIDGHKSLQRLSAKHGSILHLRVFSFPILLVSSPSLVYEIFRIHDLKVSSHGVPPIEDSIIFGSSGFLTAPYGDHWRFMKKVLITKLIGPNALEHSRGIRGAELERFYRNLVDKAKKKESVDIVKEARRLVRNSICKMSFGRGCSEENNEAEILSELSAELFALTKNFFLSQTLLKPLEKLGISLLKMEIMDVSNRYEKLLERILVEHEEKLDKEHQGEDMMDTILAIYRDEKAEYKFTRRHIKALLAELLFGGVDTSSTATQWTMAEILNNPNVLERMREEINLVVGKTRLIQETDLPNLPYLQAVLKEALRLHPNSPLLIRNFEQGCEIGSFNVPEGTVVVSFE